MISLQIKELKSFMGKLLTGTTFDSFLLTEATITTYNTFLIDGRIMNGFYSKEELEENSSLLEEFSFWSKIRPICFELVKGKRTPLQFKMIFHLAPAEVSRLLLESEISVTYTDIKAFVLTLKYNGSVLTCTTATSYRTFSLDKSADTLWDQTLTDFLVRQAIDFEKL